MSNELETKKSNALANAFASALAGLDEVTADIGGSVVSGEQVGVYANMLQQMSPAVVEGEALPGQWAISDGTDTIYVDSMSCWLLDIIGAPGKAAAVNPAPRKFFYDRNLNDLRSMYGDGPHCGSIDGIHPDPRYVEAAGIKAQGGLMDPRLKVPVMTVNADYRGNEVTQVHRLVPIVAETTCANCQMGQWLRPADGGNPMAPACEATYRALLYVYAVTGEAAEEWEPKVVILEGRSSAARMFYSSKRDRVFQQENKGAALYDEGFIDKGFRAKYMGVVEGSETVFPLVVGSIFVQGKSGPYYVPKFFNTATAFTKYIEDGAETGPAFLKLAQAISTVRFANGAENKGYEEYMRSTLGMLSNSIIPLTEPKPGMGEAFVEFTTETFKEYWKRDANGQPEGRAAMRTPIDPALLQTDNQSGTQPAATPNFGGAQPQATTTPEPAPSFPSFPGTPSATQPAVDVTLEEDTPWDD